MNEVNRIIHWFERAVPAPTHKNVAVQLGCHFEEIVEMAVLFNSGFAEDLEDFSIALKNENCTDSPSKRVEEFYPRPIPSKDRVELLDALCDQIVTAIGVTYMLRMDIKGALNEVIASNESKFVDGVPVFDENGKIMKGSDYFKPDLKKFV